MALTFVVCVSLVYVSSVAAQQQTNPVDRKVENPVTDTPNVNPLSQDQPPIRPRARRQTATAGEQTSDVLQAVRAAIERLSGSEP